jgi:hypothetical protein
MCRVLYAELLLRAGDIDQSRHWLIQAYAVNQLSSHTDKLRTMALSAGADPLSLIDVAIHQHMQASRQCCKSLSTEQLLQEANLIGSFVAESDRAEIFDQLTFALKLSA